MTDAPIYAHQSTRIHLPLSFHYHCHRHCFHQHQNATGVRVPITIYLVYIWILLLEQPTMSLASLLTYLSTDTAKMLWSHTASRKTDRLLTMPPAAGAVTLYAMSVQASITCRTYSSQTQHLTAQSIIIITSHSCKFPFSAPTLLVGQQERHPACKKLGVGGDDMTVL